MKSISMGKLPRALQDAVKVCRELSIRYLWADTLCIIQDDEDDWQKEASNMGEIYSNATVTLCALASTSCNQSFLERRVFQSWFTFVFTTIDPRDSPSHLTHIGIDMQLSKWNERAWTYQEYMLSRRMICF
ncbi:heterokaryon incompatibility, partial [Mytilinidion resinicola]